MNSNIDNELEYFNLKLDVNLYLLFAELTKSRTIIISQELYNYILTHHTYSYKVWIARRIKFKINKQIKGYVNDESEIKINNINDI
jgi:hypothetical protein